MTEKEEKRGDGDAVRIKTDFEKEEEKGEHFVRRKAMKR